MKKKNFNITLRCRSDERLDANKKNLQLKLSNQMCETGR